MYRPFLYVCIYLLSMNIYDFDKTIFYPDSVTLFVNYVITRKPSLVFNYVPKTLKAVFKVLCKKKKRQYMYIKLYGIVKYLDDPAKVVNEFWDEYETNIAEWYLKQKKEDDLIISASPEYLIKPIADRLGVKYVSTIIDTQTGVMIGNLMLARAKSKYIIDKGMPMIDNFYSDSLSDTPIALLAEKAYLVTDKGRKFSPWPHLDKDLAKKVKKKII